MWNQNSRPFPSSHPSSSLGSSLSLQPLTHQARATFTSLFPYLLASFSHLRSLLSFRNPESGTFRRVRPEEGIMHTSASRPCPWGSVSCGSYLRYLIYV